jgi:hypothetical protein
VTGTTHWDETDKTHADYAEFREQMTAEVAAACEGALDAGATEIVVKDGHWTGRNLIAVGTRAKMYKRYSAKVHDAYSPKLHNPYSGQTTQPVLAQTTQPVLG